MTSSDDKELNELSEIYETLKGDAKNIIHDLKGGVKMWREAAGANIAAGGFLLLHALTSYRLFSNPSFTSEGGLIILAEVTLAAVLFGIAAKGFSKYFSLKKKYSSLFERAAKLE